MDGLVNRRYPRRDLSPHTFHPDDSICYRTVLFQPSNTGTDKASLFGRCRSVAMGHQEVVALVLW